MGAWRIWLGTSIMPTAEMLPEAADNGFWYVTLAVIETEPSGATSIRPANVPGIGWNAWYGEINGTLYAVIKTPEIVYGVQTAPVSVSQVLHAAGFNRKPFGKVGNN